MEDTRANRPGRYVGFASIVQQVFNPVAPLSDLDRVITRIGDTGDAIHESRHETYPGARALAQDISGDPLEYMPELVPEHPIATGNIGSENLPLPSMEQIQEIINKIKTSCGK